MAMKKINYNEAKNNNSAKNQLAQAFSDSLKIAPAAESDIKMIPLKEIHLDPKGEFQKLYDKDEKDLNNIAESMKKNGFFKHQHIIMVHINEENDTFPGDGHTRLAAAEIAGIEKIPVYEVTFDTRKEALLAMYGLQINRRNLTSGQKLMAIKAMDALKNPGKKAEDSDEENGKSAEALADQLGMSTRQVERGRAILKSGDEETIEAVESGDMSLTAGYNKIKGKKSKKESSDEDDDLSDALEDNEGNPGAINFMQEHPREDVNKLTPEQDSERTLERKRANEMGFADGFKKGFGEGAYQVYDKIISMLKEGKSVEEIENDDLFTDFTYSEIAPKFEIAVSDDEILKEFNK